MASGRAEPRSSSRTFQLNGIDREPAIESIHLAQTRAGHVAYLLGRSGEPRGGTVLRLRLHHRALTQPIDAIVQTDDHGRVELGPLREVSSVELLTPSGARRQWSPTLDRAERPRAIHAGEGETIRIPVMGHRRLGEQAGVDETDEPEARVSLLERRGSAFTRDLIAAEGGPDGATHPFRPEDDVDGGYHGRGNANEWGQRYADDLRRVMDTDFNHILTSYDRAAMGHYPGARTVIGRDGIADFWLGLRSSFPSARFEIHHQIGMDADMLSPRAAIRWSLDGTHDGWGAFGRPTGARVHVMGISHAEYGPWGLRRETALYDEIAIWKQILLQAGTA